jgi:hypothetical protein
MKALKTVVAIMAFGALLSGCSKDEKSGDNGTASVAVRLTDAPGNYDEVNVDITGVEITGSGGQVTSLNINPGIYNLLDFTNGTDTLIATGDINAGTISQVRLILGSNNTVIVDSVVYPLSTPSAMQSGLKLQVHKTFVAGVAYMLLLDFDANQSIVELGNGGYQLKPVIRVIESAISGSVKGIILPPGVNTVITANGGGNVYSSSATATGEFLIPGLPPGTYDITITPVAPFLPVTVNGVVVVTGAVTDLGSITL